MEQDARNGMKENKSNAWVIANEKQIMNINIENNKT